MAISLTHISKNFVLTNRNRRPLYREMMHLLGRAMSPTDAKALDDITLDIPRGASVALIGTNGAGKTTLLRVIAGIYAPSAGELDVRGRVACFLDAGAGMAPMLPVYDNIFLYGAIVGLSHAETAASVDEILDFAELQDHRYSRVEHLSFGMQQRLFFAIMVQTMRLNKADIFLFDEWLAGADRRFKQKGEDLLRALPQEQQTIIYASHDHDRLERMCPTAIYLRGGRLRMYDQTPKVMETYTADTGTTK